MKKIVKDRGFTLIELLVVITIIGILSTVIIASLSAARRKAKVAKTQVMLNQMKIYVAGAQINQNLLLRDITGSNNTYDSCPTGVDLSQLPSTHPCVADWRHAIDDIIEAYDSSISDKSAYYTDAWGSPFLLDENEWETPGVCQVNTLTSAGEDRMAFTADDITIVLPYERC